MVDLGALDAKQPLRARVSAHFQAVWARLIARDGHPDRVYQIYSLGSIAAITNLLVALALAAIAWGQLPSEFIVVWLVLISVNVLYFYFSKNARARLKLVRISARTRRLLGVYCALFATLWAPAGVVVVTMEGTIQVWALALLWVLVMGANVVYSVIPILSLIYLLIMLTPAAIYGVVLSDDPTNGIMVSLAMVLLMIVMMTFTMKYSSMISASEARSEQRAKALALLEQAHQDIQRLAERDPTTGLRNRRSLMEILTAKLDEGGDNDHGLFLIDLDHFKHINDAYGHEFGDKYLRHVGNLMERVAGYDAIVARLGGDEFAIVTNGAMSRQKIDRLGRALLDRLSGSICIDGIDVRLGASIGVALAPSVCNNLADWLNFSDHALRTAKLAQRGTMRVFEPSDKQQMNARNKLGAELDGAIANDFIAPWYQPQLDMSTGELSGFEALARWRSPSGVHVPPPQFFELAEGRGMVLDLSEQIFIRVARDLQQWRQQGVDFGSVSLNVHPAQLHHMARLRSVLDRLIAATGSAEKITLEITENCIVGRGTEEVPAALQELASTGCRISLDDFGTGYASLTHIRNLPIHEVKIDRKFIADLEHSIADREIVRSILRIARLRDINVVAEGIETGAQIAILREEGCTTGQGFYFARPMQGGDVSAYCARLNDWHRDGTS